MILTVFINCKFIVVDFNQANAAGEADAGLIREWRMQD
jgi:hypothetical protein